MPWRSFCISVVAVALIGACASADLPEYGAGAPMRAGEWVPNRGVGPLPGTAGAVDTSAGRNQVYRDAARPIEFTDEEYRRTYPSGPRRE